MCAYESMNVFVYMSVYMNVEKMVVCMKYECRDVLKRMIVCACECRDVLMHDCRDI